MIEMTNKTREKRDRNIQRQYEPAQQVPLPPVPAPTTRG